MSLFLPLSLQALLLVTLLFGAASLSGAQTIEHQTTVSVTATVPSADATPGAPAGSTGSPGAQSSFTGAGVVVQGQSYPGSAVEVRFAQFPPREVFAGPDGSYKIDFPIVVAGAYPLTVSAIDGAGMMSASRGLRVLVLSDARTTIDGFHLPPTLYLDKLSVRPGDSLGVSGYGRPGAAVVILLGTQLLPETFVVGANGVWRGSVRIGALPLTSHTLRARHIDDAVFSRIASVRIGVRTILADRSTARILAGDINKDGKVNLVDFSIIAFWYGKKDIPSMVDLSGDGRVTLIDFSILAYEWHE